MSRGDGPAYPTDTEHQASAHTWHCTGLTVREAFALAAMQGLCANSEETTSTIAQRAVGIADATLAELERIKGE